MPKWDPIRDAILNSPTVDKGEATQPLLPNNQIGPPSPSLGRRATDLSVLLNAEPEDPRTPARSSSLSHILLPEDVGDDKLANFGSLRRNSRSDLRSEDTRMSPPPGSSHSKLPLSLSEAGPSTARPITASPISRSPVVSNSRPSSSSSSSRPTSLPRTTTSPTMPPPPPTRLPYRPRHRITPAHSILRPITPEEIETYKSAYNFGTRRLTKRKRARSDSPESGDRPPVKKLAGDVGVVVSHYNARPDVGIRQRLESPIIGLKNFNNWVKSVLITRFAHPAFLASPSQNHQNSGPERRGRGAPLGKILDIGCGKGGDLGKWSKARIKEYIGVDIAAKSVEQARERWQTMRGANFDATFAALDCYSEPLSKAFPPARLAQPFDVVSMQFCMHYAFETIQKARIMLENVSRWLRPGGIFLGTIPNADQLLERLDSLPENSKDLSFGNSVYKIQFDGREKQPIFGHKYWFFLRDAVENVPEYIVRWPNFVEMAKEYGLELKYKEEFHEVFAEHQEHPEFGPLMVRMKVVEPNGESSMDEDQWEAANIYIAFAFEKRALS